MVDALERRPKTVLIGAAFLLAAAAIAAIMGISLLFPNRFPDRLWELNPAGGAAFHVLGKILGVLLLALGVATFAAARPAPAQAVGLVVRRSAVRGKRFRRCA
jgi:hypothetical protein